MDIAVLGATGRTGRLVVEQALARGHKVTAIVRDATKLRPANNLIIIKVDVMNAEELAPTFKGKDAVLSTLGSNKDTRLIEHSTRAAIAAMQKAGVKRFITELSFGAATNIRFSRIGTLVLKLALGKMLVDQAAGIALLKNSGLDWTIVFPTILTDGDMTKKIQVLKDNAKVGVQYKIARNDVAYFMLETLENRTYSRQGLVITGL